MFKTWRKWWLLAAALAGTGTLASAESPAQSAMALPSQRIVTFQPGVSAAQRLKIIRDRGGIVLHDLRLINAVAAQFPPERVKTLESELKSLPEVARIEQDYRQKWIESSMPAWSDVEFPSVRSVIRPFTAQGRPKAEPSVPWGVAKVNAPQAWSVTRGKGVKVAIIDTGIDYTHPQLKGNVKGGWNAVTSSGSTDFKDDNGHGSHVSGTIAAAQSPDADAARAVWGIAPEAQLYGVKVLDAGGSGTFADVIAGIQWAADHKMDVANMSLGASQGTDALEEAVRAAVKSGLTIVAAAGNSGGAVGYPAAYPEVIAVSAIDDKDQIAWWSSRGPQVALTAPGVNVPSTWRTDDGSYKTISGTSMACPHVVGLSALAISAKHVHGSDRVRAALKAAATKLPGLSDEEQGAGLVDAAKLVH